MTGELRGGSEVTSVVNFVEKQMIGGELSRGTVGAVSIIRNNTRYGLPFM